MAVFMMVQRDQHRVDRIQLLAAHIDCIALVIGLAFECGAIHPVRTPRAHRFSCCQPSLCIYVPIEIRYHLS